MNRPPAPPAPTAIVVASARQGKDREHRRHRVAGIQRPFDAGVSGSDRQRFSGHGAGGREDADQCDRADAQPQPHRNANRSGLCRDDGARANSTRGAAAQQPQQCGPAKVAKVERGCAGHREQRGRAVDGDEHDVTRCRGEHGGQQHVAGEVLPVRNLKRKHHARRRCLEDRRNTSGRATHHERVGIDRCHTPAQSLADPRPDDRPEVNGRPLETHRRAQSERCAARQQLRRRLPLIQPMVGVVELLDVLVRRRRRLAPADPAQNRALQPRARPPERLLGPTTASPGLGREHLSARSDRTRRRRDR